MTRVTLYGGVSEVGGNKVLLESENSRVFFDFGLSYSRRSRFFSDPFFSPRSKEALIQLGIAHPMRGTYWFQDLCRGETAVFLSHVHRDHCGHVSLLNKRIPVFCGRTTEIMLDALRQMSRETPEFDLSDITFNNFKSWDKVRVGGVRVKPIHVDHSVPGSYGFLAEADGASVAYTGDFRMHGKMTTLSKDFEGALADERPDVLIMEHTNILDGEVTSEEMVGEKVHAVVEGTKGLVVSDFSISDVDRYSTFRRVADGTGREVVMSPRRAFMLMQLRKDPRLKIPPIEGTCVLRKDKRQLRKWEESALACTRSLTPQEVASKQSQYLLMMPPSDMETLLKVPLRPGSCYIYSSSEPFNEEMENDFERLMNWLDFLGMPYYHIHASGHIMPLQMRRFVEVVAPKMLVPIHGTHPELISKFMKDVCDNVVVPKIGEPIVIQ